jgi:hypothetical protein
MDIRKIIQEEISKVIWTNPNFNMEWEEAKRYPEFIEMGKDKYMEKAHEGYKIMYNEIKDELGNVDLEFDTLEPSKIDRFKKNYSIGKMEMPIVVKFTDGYDLMAGNTRLSGMVNKGEDVPLWVIDMTTLNESEFDWVKDIVGDVERTPLDNIRMPKVGEKLKLNSPFLKKDETGIMTITNVSNDMVNFERDGHTYSFEIEQFLDGVDSDITTYQN